MSQLYQSYKGGVDQLAVTSHNPDNPNKGEVEQLHMCHVVQDDGTFGEDADGPIRNMQ